MVNAILKIMAPLTRRVRLMVGRCVLTLLDDSLPLQKVQITILDGEVHDGVERVQNFGFSAVPLAGARGVTVSVGGDRAHQVIVAMDDGRHRPTNMQPGESVMYNSHGVTLKFLADGTATLVCKTLLVQAETKVRLETPLFEVTGDIVAAGDVADAGGSKTMLGMRSAFNTHTQPVNGNTAAVPPGGM